MALFALQSLWAALATEINITRCKKYVKSPAQGHIFGGLFVVVCVKGWSVTLGVGLFDNDVATKRQVT
ncbi:hypothetical protein D9B51_08830 [Corynebacterium diphtheriae]|nr:hypothetical protein BU161_11490 [Corynebacterium diphtheriae]RKW94179.1 hypothetical protein D9B51_08830 [Corynebacterium diphtheriae]